MEVLNVMRLLEPREGMCSRLQFRDSMVTTITVGVGVCKAWSVVRKRRMKVSVICKRMDLVRVSKQKVIHD